MDTEVYLKCLDLLAVFEKEQGQPLQMIVNNGLGECHPSLQNRIIGKIDERGCKVVPLEISSGDVAHDVWFLSGEYYSFKQLREKYTDCFKVLRSAPANWYSQNLVSLAWDYSLDFAKKKGKNVSECGLLVKSGWFQKPREFPPYRQIYSIFDQCSGSEFKGEYDFMDGEYLEGFKAMLDENKIPYFRTELFFDFNGISVKENGSFSKVADIHIQSAEELANETRATLPR